MASIGQVIFWSIIVLIVIVGALLILLLAIAFSRSQNSSVQSMDSFPVGNLGQDVLLDCTFDPLSVNGKQATDATITWEKEGLSGVVYMYQNRMAQLQNQNQLFTNRAQLFPSAIANGNASLLLLNVTIEDEGVYRCSVSAPSGQGVVSIHLMVAAYSAPNITRDSDKLTAVAMTWYPKPDVKWTNQSGNVLNSTVFTNNSAGMFMVITTLSEPVSKGDTYTCLIQNSVVEAVSRATVTDTGVSVDTLFLFNSSPSLLHEHLNVLIILHLWVCWIHY